MVFPKIAAFWNTFIVAFAIWELSDWVQSNKESIAYNYGEDSLKYFSGSWSLTFGGWLAVIVTLAIIVMLFRISKKTR